MKKIYLFLLAIFFIAAYTNAQQIEIVGEGINGQTSATLIIDDANLADINFYVDYLHNPGQTLPIGIFNFADANEDYDVTYQGADIYKTTYPYIAGLGYFKQNFNSLDAGGVSVNYDPVNKDFVHAFYAIVERNIPDADYYSVFDDTHVFFWHDYEQDETYTYSLPLQASTLNRNVTVTIPFSEIDSNDDDRYAIVDVESGGVTVQAIIVENLNGDFFHIETIDLLNVPASATSVEVTITSPDKIGNDPGGDSFMTGGVLIDVYDIDPGCTLTQGYWKTHGTEGPAGPYNDTWEQIEDETFFLSGMDYYDAIREKAKGNAYYMLAHQYIAARLNGLSDADFTDAQNAFDDATGLFENNEPGDIKKLKGNSPLRKQFIDAADILTDYNEGTIGPGHCDDGEEDDDKSVEANINKTSGELVVYPNPMSSYGTLKFVAAETANTTVEVYNLVGTRVDMLFNDHVESGSQTSFSIDANKYPKGMYIIYIRNGSTVYKEKLSIMN